MLRCKFHVASVKSSKDQTGKYAQEEIVARAVYGDENAEWSTATPAGQLTITISNPDAFDRLLPGQAIYLDISPAE